MKIILLFIVSITILVITHFTISGIINLAILTCQSIFSNSDILGKEINIYIQYNDLNHIKAILYVFLFLITLSLFNIVNSILFFILGKVRKLVSLKTGWTTIVVCFIIISTLTAIGITIEYNIKDTVIGIITLGIIYYIIYKLYRHIKNNKSLRRDTVLTFIYRTHNN